MTNITTARKVVIDYCRKSYDESQVKTTPIEFGLALTSIYRDTASNEGFLSPEQARFIAKGSWSLAMELVDPSVAIAFSCLAMHDGFEDMSDQDRVVALADRVLRLCAGKSSVRLQAETLSMGVRIATDALLASAPEMFQEG